MKASQCLSCRSYRRCNGKEWYSYTDIRWCPWQSLWIIQHGPLLEQGKWPPHPDGEPEVERGIKTGYKSEAYFTKPVEIVAEVRRRLHGVPLSCREALLRECDSHILSLKDLSYPAYMALMYIKGRNRKIMAYHDWRKQVEYRRVQNDRQKG